MVPAIVLWEDRDVAGSDVPARIVVTDDLRRSRVTVFFRLVLFIPHLVWLVLWTIVALLAAIANWFATLATGRPPDALYRFLSAYIRYATHVSAFLLLAGNPFPGFTGAAGSYPVDVEVAPLERQHRLKTLFRIVLAIPALALAAAIRSASAGAGASHRNGTRSFSFDLGLLAACALLGWFASLVRGRMPQGLRNAIAWGLGYGAQVNAYVFLLSDRYPNTDPGATGILGIPPEHPVRLRVDDDLRRSRLRVFFRLFLFIPHLVWLVLWGIAVLVVVIVNWFATLAVGRSPRSLHRFLSAYLRYQTHVFAFIGLVADPWPGFLGRPGYPVDLELPGPERQHRLRTLFRIFLAVPAFFVNGGLSSLGVLIAFLGWFVALVTGRMPTGFRNVGAWALRYALQLDAYLYLVTDRYPYSGPEAGEAAEPETEELESPPLTA
jgi:Domain of unknown function (DUF4389)